MVSCVGLLNSSRCFVMVSKFFLAASCLSWIYGAFCCACTGMIVVTMMAMIEAVAGVEALRRDQVGVIVVKVGTVIAAVVEALAGMTELHPLVNGHHCTVFTRQ